MPTKISAVAMVTLALEFQALSGLSFTPIRATVRNITDSMPSTYLFNMLLRLELELADKGLFCL